MAHSTMTTVGRLRNCAGLFVICVRLCPALAPARLTDFRLAQEQWLSLPYRPSTL